MIFRKIKKIVRNELDLLKAKLDLKYNEDSVLSFRDFILPKKEKLPIQEYFFLLFSYEKHLPVFGLSNLGDYIQTIATKKALDSIFLKCSYRFHDRDSLLSYSAGGGDYSCCYARLVCSFNAFYSQ